MDDVDPIYRARHGHKYTKYKNMMILVCIKQHLSNIWISIHENVNEHWGWVGKSVAYKNSVKLTSIPLEITGKWMFFWWFHCTKNEVFH